MSGTAAGAGRFAGKVALVTGAASGIGRAVALAFAREGAALALGDRDAAGLAETARLAATRACWTETLDVTNAASVAGFVNGAAKQFGRLDCAVNAAGIGGFLPKLVAEFTEEDYDAMMGVNAKGVWLCMKYEINAMLASGGAPVNCAIVNIASGAGLITVPGNGTYVASKHAVMGLTKAAGADYAAKGIRVNAVCPGFTRTPMAVTSISNMGLREEDAAKAAPIGRIAEPEEQAAAVLFLCSDAASFMAGHGLVVDGGHSIV